MTVSRISILALLACGSLALAAAPRASAQDLYISDFDNSQILEYTQAGTLTRTFSSNSLFTNPDGLAFSGSSLYVSAQKAGTTDGAIYRYDLNSPSADPTLFATDSGGVLSGLVFGSGSLYAADSQNGKIVVFDSQTGTQTGSFGNSSSGTLISPIGLAFQNASLYVSDSGANDVLKYDSAGTFQGTYITAGSGGLQSPGDIIFDPSGNLLVASGQGANNSDSVDRYDVSGKPNPSTGGSGAVFASDPGLFNPYGVAISPSGAVFVGDRNSNNSNGSGGGGHFDQFNADGTFAKSFAFNGGSGNPYGLAFGPSAAPVPSAAPEPSVAASLGLFVVGLGGLLAFKRFRARS